MTNVINIKSSTSTEVNPALREVVQGIFDQMLLAYGKKFVDSWSAADPDKLADFWTVQLTGYTPREIKRGLAALDARDWPPSLPEFKKMCRPPIDPLTSYYEAVTGCQERAKGEIGTWSHPAIFWAAVPLSYDLLSQSYSQIKARWEKAFTEQLELGQWEEIPKPMIALAAPGKSRTDNTAAAKVLSEIGATEKMKVKREDTAWYRKLFDRIKTGDKTVTMIQRQFAEEAAKAHGYRG